MPSLPSIPSTSPGPRAAEQFSTEQSGSDQSGTDLTSIGPSSTRLSSTRPSSARLSSTGLPSSALRRLARHNASAPSARTDSGATSPPADVEHCDLCADQVPGRHRHLLDTGRRQILCACQACGVLFDRQAAGSGQYRLIRPLRRPLPDLRCDGPLWAGLGVPVDLAFFVRHEPAGTGTAYAVTAHYPNPIGTVGAEVAPEAWQRLVEANPPLTDMDTEVVALLIRQARRTGDASRRGESQQWLLGIDDCYQLTALLRQSWTGLSGGDRVWRQIDAYFDRLREEPVP